MEGREREPWIFGETTQEAKIFLGFFVNVHESVDFPFISEFHSSWKMYMAGGGKEMMIIEPTFT